MTLSYEYTFDSKRPHGNAMLIYIPVDPEAGIGLRVDGDKGELELDEPQLVIMEVDGIRVATDEELYF